MAHGHTEAQQYPVGLLMDEADIVRTYIDNTQANEAVWIQMAVASVLTKKGSTAFNKAVNKVRK